MSSGRVVSRPVTAGTGNWGWVFARPVTAGTGVNGLTNAFVLTSTSSHLSNGNTKFAKRERDIFKT